MLSKKRENFLKGKGVKHLSPVPFLHDEKKNGFTVLDTLSGNVRDLSPQKSNTPYSDMNLQVESGNFKRVLFFSKQKFSKIQEH